MDAKRVWRQTRRPALLFCKRVSNKGKSILKNQLPGQTKSPHCIDAFKRANIDKQLLGNFTFV